MTLKPRARSKSLTPHVGISSVLAGAMECSALKNEARQLLEALMFNAPAHKLQALVAELEAQAVAR